MKKKSLIYAILLVSLIILGILFISLIFGKKDEGQSGTKVQPQSGSQSVDYEEIARQEAEALRNATILEAKRVALSYDYDGAVSMLEAIDGYAEDEELLALKDEFLSEKAKCVPIDLETVTHIFYHSLNVDPERGFKNPNHKRECVGHNQWMTTISEFNKITQEMYDRGYVLVDFNEAVAGNVSLPPGKIPFVLSLDDLSYYHVYDGFGYATKLVLDEHGKVACEYTDAQGVTTIGKYDAVPLLDAFIEEHPDASYKGAKGIVALTGYNGILGYRTDETYDYNHPSCDRFQKAWMDAHPDFNLEEDRAKAKEIADAMRANGWSFASHTWGHIKTNEVSMERVKRDTERWLNNVAPLVGGTDMLIFAHGADFVKGGVYSNSDEKYIYYKNQGFTKFFGVDAKVNTLKVYDDYVYQGRRNLDGYRIYYNSIGQQNNVSDLFDAKTVLDPERPPVEPL